MNSTIPAGDNSLLKETVSERKISWLERFLGPENFRIIKGLFKTPASILGIGQAAAAAAQQLDVVTVLGFALFNGMILITANLVVDILYGIIDPRVRLS